MRRDLGDFQTPPALVSAVLDRLDSLGIPHDRVLEPTCGLGGFVAGLLDRPVPPREIRGYEIQADYVEACRAYSRGRTVVHVERADLFGVDLASRPDWTTAGPLLVVGNPPWVTTGELGRLGSVNRPERSKVVGLSGLDARTGRANFDLAEAVWHKLLNEIREPDATIALLCKTTTARNVLRWAVRAGRPVASATIHRVDARRWFGAAVDACLFVVRLGPTPARLRVDVYPDLASDTPEATIGVIDGQLIADLDGFARSLSAFGRSPIAWRQGVKHDAAALMELVEHGGELRNGLGEMVDVEPEHVYPLAKGADLGRVGFDGPSRRVLVTHRRLGEDTRGLEARSPRLWDYLTRHAGAFAARRSKVYERRPPFSMFGIGAYTFSAWKVAVSGLHKEARFRAVGPVDGKPVLFDDTCYFLPVDHPDEADRILGLLDTTMARTLIASIRFHDAKRPITKGLLSRIDLDALGGFCPLATAIGVE